jgi:transcriptional antiterminator RfaH
MAMQQRVNGSRQQLGEGLAWYCVRSRRKFEQVAAAHVKVLGDTSFFCPRIRFRRPSKQGWIWVTEALFPGYFFARFSLKEMLPRVRSAHGVSSVVRFGEWYPEIADNVIEELQAETADDEAVSQLVQALMPGERVRLLKGPLAGMEAVVTQVLPGNERVRLLLEFLGRESFAETEADNVVVAEGVGWGVLRMAARISNLEPPARLTVLDPFSLENLSRNGTDG